MAVALRGPSIRHGTHCLEADPWCEGAPGLGGERRGSKDLGEAGGNHEVNVHDRESGGERPAHGEAGVVGGHNDRDGNEGIPRLFGRDSRGKSFSGKPPVWDQVYHARARHPSLRNRIRKCHPVCVAAATDNDEFGDDTGFVVSPHACSANLLTVSYTHLRAHETPEHPVCRLLLEKKNNKYG